MTHRSAQPPSLPATSAFAAAPALATLLSLAFATMLSCLLAPRTAGADDALIEVGVTQEWMRLSILDVKTLPATGITAGWMFMDGRGEAGVGARITAWKPLWGGSEDHVGFDAMFVGRFGGRFGERKFNIMPYFGFGAGFRSLLVTVTEGSTKALSGLGVSLGLGIHGHTGRRSGMYWRLGGFATGHLLFPEAGWDIGGGVELTLGGYVD